MTFKASFAGTFDDEVTRGERLRYSGDHLLAARYGRALSVRRHVSRSCAIEALAGPRPAAAGMSQAGVRPIAFSCPAPDGFN
jgi:hypothetical protein